MVLLALASLFCQGEIEMNYLTSHLLILRALLCVTLVSIFSCSDRNIVARGQDLDNVTIGGLVIDQNGSLIPGATVIAIMVKTGVSRTTNTDDEGHYRLIQLEPGGYTVRVSAAGFESLERENLVTVAGQNVRLNLKLYPAGVIVKPVIVSTTDTPLIDTTRTVVGGTVAARETASPTNLTRAPLEPIIPPPR